MFTVNSMVKLKLYEEKSVTTGLLLMPLFSVYVLFSKTGRTADGTS